MAILPFLGLSKGRLVSLLRVALGKASHRDTRHGGKERVGGVSLYGNADALVGISTATFCDDSTATPPKNAVRQNAEQIRAFA